jgi:hypothetical protein
MKQVRRSSHGSKVGTTRIAGTRPWVIFHRRSSRDASLEEEETNTRQKHKLNIVRDTPRPTSAYSVPPSWYDCVRSATHAEVANDPISSEILLLTKTPDSDIAIKNPQGIWKTVEQAVGSQLKNFDLRAATRFGALGSEAVLREEG